MKSKLFHSILFLALFITMTGKADAQSSNWLWAKSIGGINNDRGNAVAIDVAGNVYITGTFESTVDFDPGPVVFNLTSNGSVDIFISKSDPSGNLLWVKSIGDTSIDAGNSLTLDESCNVYFTGQYYGVIDFDPGPAIHYLYSAYSTHRSDIFISKFDSSGNYKWAKKIGDKFQQYGPSITLDDSNHVYTTGKFNGTVDFDPGSGIYKLHGDGDIDLFISKLTAAGQFVWARAMESSNNSLSINSNAIAIDTAGNGAVYTTGNYQNGNPDFDPGPGIYNLGLIWSHSNIFISKLDHEGNFVWAKAFDGVSWDNSNSITIDPSGNGDVYITGHFAGTTDFDPGPGVYNLTPTGIYGIFICKLDSAGNFLWAKSMGGPDYNDGLCIRSDPAGTGDIYLAGYFNGTADFDPGPGTTNLTSAGGQDLFLAKYTSQGNFLWAKSEGGAGNDVSTSLFVDITGNVRLTGYFYSPTLSFGTVSLINTHIPGTTSDIFISEFTCPTSSAFQIFACNSYTSPSGHYVWSNNGTYLDTIPNSLGCDSVMEISLFIGSVSSASSLTFTACDNYISPSGANNWNSSGIYMDTIPNAVGCDSVMTINLTIINSTSSSISDTGCNSYLSPSGQYTWTANGTYQDTIPNAGGCDSIITINLTLNKTYSYLTDTACFTYASPSSNYTWNISGTFMDTVPNSIGCDSIIEIQLTIKTVNSSVSQNGFIFSANATGAGYQWLDCNNGFAPISGETNQIFIAVSNGSYALAVTQDGCTDTSACYTVTGIGISEISSGSNFEIFPNPACSDFTIIFKNQNKKSELTIRDLTGKLIYAITVTDKRNIKVNTKDFEKGIYFVKIQTQDFVETKKIIVMK